MKGYIVNIEKETIDNKEYRRVLYTAKNCQLVLMSIKPGDEIGVEVHMLDQFIRIEEGVGTAYMDGNTHELGADHAVIILAGMRHNIVNTGDSDLKLYTVYAPPEHKDGVVVRTKADEQEEHFDGKTTE